MSKDSGMTALPFVKMHGLGNDFVVIDARKANPGLGKQQVVTIADRRTGVGCDQLLVLEPSKSADVFMRIYNQDGTEAGACGNGTRCIAALVMEEKGAKETKIETVAGVIACRETPQGVAIDMGVPAFEWRKVPLAEARDTLHLGLKMGALQNPCALSVGNPHAVFFVEDANAIELSRLGPKIETYFLFPERVNVSVAQVLSEADIRLRVWERGTGITRACGTAAAATLAAAHKRGLTGKYVNFHMDGGKLTVEWRDNGHLILTGPAEKSFSGEFHLPAKAAEESAA